MLKLVTKHNQNVVVDKAGLILHYEFTLYRLTMNFYVPPFRSNYGLLQGVAKIDAYGIIVRMALEQDGLLIIEESDKGPLSAQQFEVSGLLSILCQMEAPSIQKVNEEISRAQLLWSANKWGSPFGKTAERAYLDKYRKDHYARSPKHSEFAQLNGNYSANKQLNTSKTE